MPAITLRPTAFLPLLCLTGLLTGCGNSDNDPETAAPATPMAAGALQPVTDAQLAVYLQQALGADTSVKVMADMAAAGVPGVEGVGGAMAVSGTVLQEAGVDEADLIKSDGVDVYSVLPTAIPAVQRHRLQPGAADAALQPVETLTSPLRNNTAIQGLYLDAPGKTLVALGEAGNYGDDYQRWFRPLSWVGGRTELAVMATGETLTPRYTLGISAQLVGSRRIGHTLYLVLRSRAQPSGFDPAWTLAARGANQTKLDTLKVADLLPTLTVNDGAPAPLLPPDSCLAPVKAAEASADIITLVGIDLSAAAPVVAARCFAGSTEAFYLSEHNLYLATTRWAYTRSADVNGMVYPPQVTTDIHQFALDTLAPGYRGSGTVAGHLGFDQNRKSFRLGEYNGILRVATQTAERWGPVIAVPVAAAVTESPVRLTLLKASATGKSLDVVSTLPNERRPAPLGKAGEQLYASRFLGNRGYLVTYRLTDPLYVLDLSDPADPKVAGALEVDGYSDYLFPLSERYLLGVGKDARSDGSAGDGRFAWYQGVKVSVMDVSDPSRPLEVARQVIGQRGTDATVLHDHHGIALLSAADGSSVRVALPVSLHALAPEGASGAPSDYFGFSRTQLSRFDVNLTTGAMVQAADLVADDGAAQRDVGNDRSLLAAGQVHHYRNGLWASWRWE